MSGDPSKGFRFVHDQINETVKNSLQSRSFLYALIDILESKGFISIDELDKRKREIAAKLVERHSKSGLGLMVQDPEMDKYAFEGVSDVDCDEMCLRCKAVCCKIPFALSRQDVEEGIVKWDFGRPYVIAHGDDGYCLHLNRKTYRCTVHQHRPVPCRGFDCRNTKRWNIWKDEACTALDPDLPERIQSAVNACYGKGKSDNPQN